MTQNAISHEQVTAAEALQRLKEGNHRFSNGMSLNKDMLAAIQKTKDGQKPYAAILSCMDSRTSVELIFDQGVGSIFSIRVAGNIVSDDVLGSLEYATVAAGSKLILVMGHTNCGAVKGACDHVELGHLTSLLHRIQPAVEMADKMFPNDRNSGNTDDVDAVTEFNTQNSIQEILQRSLLISGLVAEGKVGIASATYDVSTGQVHFGRLKA